MQHILVHGHRGARAILAENTLAGFEYAIRAGADVLEMDVAVTRDDVPVVSHDPVINPEICKGPHLGEAIRSLTLAQVREHDCGSLTNPRFPKQAAVPGARIPTLDEVLDSGARGKVQFNIELKSFPEHPDLAPHPELFSRLVLDVIRRHRLTDRCFVQSFDFRILAAVSELAPQIRIAALWEGLPRSFVDIAKEGFAGIVAPQFEMVTTERVREAHAAGLQVVPWTANTSEAWRELTDAGVDGIITDDPAALIAYLKREDLQ